MPTHRLGTTQEDNVTSKQLAQNSSQDVKPSQTIDPEEEPSVDWGWHGSFPNGIQIWGWVTVLACIAMLFGNHQGILSGGGVITTADIYLIGTAVVVAIALVINLRRRRRVSWRR